MPFFALILEGGETVFFFLYNGTGMLEYLSANIRPIPHTICKSSKWTIDLNSKPKTAKLLQEDII